MGCPKLIDSISDIRAYVLDKKKQGLKIALVPTMGALHDGHLALVDAAQKNSDVVIVSIFVNPTQFGPSEDFGSYPRTLKQDLEKLERYNVDCVFSPSVNEIYPEGFSTSIHISGITDVLCGSLRQGHFDGVGLVVTKLFMLCSPDIAVFGEKDFQQICVIKRLVKDLNVPVSIVPIATVRDSNGLALSSRNKYLDQDQYKTACRLNVILSEMVQKLNSKKCSINDCLSWGKEALKQEGFETIDYLEIRNSEDLTITNEVHEKLRVFVAVKLGKARLIDNISLKQ